MQQLLFDEEGRPEAREGKFLLAAAVTDSLNREFGRLVIAPPIISRAGEKVKMVSAARA